MRWGREEHRDASRGVIGHDHAQMACFPLAQWKSYVLRDPDSYEEHSARIAYTLHRIIFHPVSFCLIYSTFYDERACPGNQRSSPLFLSSSSSFSLPPLSPLVRRIRCVNWNRFIVLPSAITIQKQLRARPAKRFDRCLLDKRNFARFLEKEKEVSALIVNCELLMNKILNEIRNFLIVIMSWLHTDVRDWVIISTFRRSRRDSFSFPFDNNEMLFPLWSCSL